MFMSWGTYDPDAARHAEHRETLRKHKRKIWVGLTLTVALLIWWGEYGFGV